MANSTTVQEIPRVPETIDFSAEEGKILTLWEKLDVFYTCLKQSKGKPRYSFYDGPPFATGLPHYGHILTGTIKDVVTRYAHQQGFHVERRFGWDCHGLPVEFEIDKTLGIKGPEDVAKMGISKYNSECRKIVTRYVKEWETIVGRMGRWIDFKNDYKTLYPWYMESIWWVFKQLYLKGLVYQGNKVMPYSTACNTPLSNFESGQNYKDVVDPAVTVTLPLIGDKDGASLLIWTTTPWTLPSNLAACVNPTLVYVRVKEISSGRVFIVLEPRAEFIFKQGDYEILEQFPGLKLKDLQYEPIFPYYKEMRKQGAFRVLIDDYVSAEAGTGVVHQAAYFGEDDFRVCLANGVITRDQDPVCPIDPSGRFTKPVTDYEGMYFKDADKPIMAALKANNRLYHVTQVKHSYPFCWRSETPLIYRAVPSWFIRVEHMSEELQKASSATYWIPDFVKEKRFGNWLREARDWAVSRNRYWGTPIPIWISASGDEVCCIGSIKELEELTGTKITDLHRENIDHLEIPSKIPGNPPLRRVPEVFDCWFESGSMPFAQQHYPFGNMKEFEEQFPADFVGEGIDQTRGWFYTLLVVSTALFGKAPFKNLIANGLVLASDGQKMSKRKKNYPDPMEIVSKYGADALRLYLINSPVVRAENLRFKEEGVRDIIKDVFLPWYNAFRFLMQNIEIYVQENNLPFRYFEENVGNSKNIMDCWILSFTQSLLEYVRKEMALYHLYNVVPRLTKYVDHLTNWYVRMNRKRLKGEGGPEDCKQALTTLFNVLFNIIKLMAPFSPFLTEHMYQCLKKLTDVDADSIHYLMLPQPNHSLIDSSIERAVSRMQSVIELGRVLRDRKTIPIKYPLPEIVVVHQDSQYINDVKSLEWYVLSEMNVRKLTVTTDKNKYGISLRAEPDHKVLGIRLKQDFKAVTAAIKALSDAEINEMITKGYRDIVGKRVELSEVRLIFKADDVTSSKYEVHSDNDVLVLLDVTPDSSMQDEGTAREIINRIQKLRKKAHLVPTDEISVYYKTSGDLARVASSHKEFIETAIKASFEPQDDCKSSDPIIIEEQQQLKEFNLNLILRGLRKANEAIDIQKEKLINKRKDNEAPIVKWVNIQLHKLKSQYGNGHTQGIVLLNVNNQLLSLSQLKSEISTIFGIYTEFDLRYTKGLIENDNQLHSLNGHTVFVLPAGATEKNNMLQASQPFCKVLNFKEKGIEGTLVLENPVGIITLEEKDYQKVINKWVENSQKKT
ncbi:hypothetical protein ILUMI_21774 [Ignelater luminosus]|uniref:Isoleucine--tRNA ligase, cytoplasmic n=1 Tax=Ignelater luminosus TaxID=2038154 RepID=A0A8K0CIB2_IGNLU|nr:hypothetical protein ILUMI_21774 [Ignelater luminosus]